MKKKILGFIFALCLIIPCAIVLSACMNDDSGYVGLTYIVDGTEYATRAYGAELDNPQAPQKENYIFKGWFLDKDSWEEELTQEKVDDFAGKGEGVNVYAKWQSIFRVSGNSITGFTSDAGWESLMSSYTTLNIPNHIKDCSVDVDIHSIGSYGLRLNYVGTINIAEGITTIGKWALNNYASSARLNVINLPASLISLAENFAYAPNLTRISIAEGNSMYYSDSSCLIERDTNKLVMGCKNGAISSQVTQIGEYAFTNRNITRMNIPEGVTSIYLSAFSDCKNLVSLRVPSTCTEIITNTVNLRSSYKITSITVDSNNSRYYSTSNIIIDKEEKAIIVGLTSSSIPRDESVKKIKAKAFVFGASQSFYHVVSKNIEEIEQYAFDLYDETSGGSMGDVKIFFEYELNNIPSGYHIQVINTQYYYYSETKPTGNTERNYWHYDEDGTTPVVW